MDERRALLAVVLIFLVLFGYNAFMSRTAPPPEATPERTGEQPAAGGRAAPAASGAQEPAGEPAAGESQAAAPERGALPGGAEAVAAEPERTVLVETPLWVATFSTRGAAITSWRLKEYNDASGSAVDLVPAGSRGLAVDVGYGPTSVGTTDWEFSYAGPERVALGGDGGEVELAFEASRDGLAVSKKYTLSADGYAFRLALRVSGLKEPGARREVWVAWPGVVPSEAKEDKNASASVALVDGKTVRTRGQSLKEGDVERRTGAVEWVTSQSQYFVTAVVPDGASFAAVEVFGDREAGTTGFRAAHQVEGESTDAAFLVYAGPQDYHALQSMGRHLDRAIDLGWAVFRPISAFMLVALLWAHRFIPNYGVVIIIFSILTKLIFYRLTHKSFTEMKRMQDLQPKLAALKEKHGKDREALAKAQMELYKKEGVNPMGSCLPMLLQMPVFIALYQVLRTTIELRGAPFALWITDLSKPDTVAAIAGFPIHILPLLMGAAMLAQQRMSSKDPSQAIINNLMPIVFTALFYSFASGLVIYWLVNTVLSVAQQFIVQRGTPAASARGAAAPDGWPASSDLPPAADSPATDAVVVDTVKGGASRATRGGRGRGRR
jgi:YidC/Oxa1 family membrane protein insertase